MRPIPLAESYPFYARFILACIVIEGETVAWEDSHIPRTSAPMRFVFDLNVSHWRIPNPGRVRIAPFIA